jgi:hypothetical protein
VLDRVPAESGMDAEGEAMERDATSRTPLKEPKGCGIPHHLLIRVTRCSTVTCSSANGPTNSANPRISANATSKMKG